MRHALIALTALGLAVAGCTGTTDPIGTKGSRVYNVSSVSQAKVQYRMLDSVNALRQAAGALPLSLNSQLTAAAETHARDMSLQNRPWHFGSDGSSPLDRVQRAGYTGELRGETISETFETELETLAAWMAEDATRDVLLDPEATDLGFAWFQESNGKIWWTLVTGATPTAAADLPQG